MICSKCKKNTATSILHCEMALGHSYTVALCDECKKTFEPSELYKQTTRLIPLTKCTRCGATLEELTNGKRSFCPECYSSFGEELSDYMMKLHRSDIHKGKRPKNKDDDHNVSDIKSNFEDVLSKLESDLSEAIKDERYEQAALIRDEIKRIKQGVDVSGK